MTQAEIAKLQDRQAVTARLQQSLADHVDMFEELHALLTGYFMEVCPAGPVSRRDPAALRLPLAGEPIARLLIRPDCQRGWCKGMGHQTLPHVQLLDVQEMLPAGSSHSRKWRDRWLGIRLKAEGPVLTRYSYQYAGDMIPRLASVVRTLLTDPAEAFRLSSEWCCCCGRKLTEPASIARGIGPECWRIMEYWDRTTSTHTSGVKHPA